VTIVQFLFQKQGTYGSSHSRTDLSSLYFSQKVNTIWRDGLFLLKKPTAHKSSYWLNSNILVWLLAPSSPSSFSWLVLKARISFPLPSLNKTNSSTERFQPVHKNPIFLKRVFYQSFSEDIVKVSQCQVDSMQRITQGCTSCWFALIISSILLLLDNCSLSRCQSSSSLSLFIWLNNLNSRSLLIIHSYLRLAKSKHGFSINYSEIVFRSCWRRKLSLSLVTLNLALRSLILSFTWIVVFLTTSFDCFRIFWLMTFVNGVAFFHNSSIIFHCWLDLHSKTQII